MKTIKIPGYGELTIKNIIFDMNGTIQFNGKISDQIVKKIKELKKFFNIYLVSSDTRGNLKEIAKYLGVEYIKLSDQEISDTDAKNNELIKLGKEETVTFGNGNNDSLMLKNAILSIVIIGSEGATIKSLMNADIVFSNPLDAINFLLDDKSIIGTLRS